MEVVDADLISLKIFKAIKFVVFVLPQIVAACQADKPMHFVSVKVLVLGESVEDLSSALRVTNKCHLWLLCHFLDLQHGGRDIILAHVRPAEVPVILQSPPRLTVILVDIAVHGAPIIAKPDIVALFS